jgi:hypothetical protein
VKLQKDGPIVPPSLKYRCGLDLYGLEKEQLEEMLEQFTPLNYFELQKELDEIPPIFLSKDPTTAGVSILNEHLAEVQAYKQRVADIRMQCLKSKAVLDKIRRTVDYKYDIMLNELLLSEEIAKMKNVTQQKAAATQQLPEWIKRLKFGVSELMSELDMFLKNVEAKHEELHDVNSNLSRQVTVVQIEVSLFDR